MGRLERWGERLRDRLPEWFTEGLALLVIIVCTAFLCILP